MEQRFRFEAYISWDYRRTDPSLFIPGEGIFGCKKRSWKIMSDDEVELGGKAAGDDYEVVPVGPLRKLERRVDELQEKNKQGSGTDDELVRDVLDIMKSNQKIVNDMTESTHELKNSVEDLTHKMDEVVDNMNSFMDLLTEASEMDMEGELVGDMEQRIAEAIGTKMEDVAEDMRESNQAVVEHLNEINENIRRNYAAQNKDGIVSRSDQNQQHSRPQQRQNQGQGKDDSQRQDRQRGRSRSTNDSNDMDLGSDNSDRMEALRKRFNKTGNNEQ